MGAEGRRREGVTLSRAYLLAAGRGRRAGGPKAWRVREGRSLLERQIGFLTGFLPPDAVAVSVQEAWLDRCRGLHPGVRWVAADADAPPLASLQRLIADRPLDRWASLHHVDMPVWEEALFRELAGRIPEAEARGAAAIVPESGGGGGHPVLLSPRCAPELAALDPARDRLDAWLRGRPVLRAPVAFPCVRENWNY